MGSIPRAQASKAAHSLYPKGLPPGKRDLSRFMSLTAADEKNPEEDDANARPQPAREFLPSHPADHDRDHGIDIGVGAYLGGGDVADEPVESDEADQGAKKQKIKKRLDHP